MGVVYRRTIATVALAYEMNGAAEAGEKKTRNCWITMQKRTNETVSFLSGGKEEEREGLEGFGGNKNGSHMYGGHFGFLNSITKSTSGVVLTIRRGYFLMGSCDVVLS